jgi:formylglycine-generating enzyme required for sulfatase activity
MTDCGDAATESCCTTLQVAGGPFYRTYDYSDAGTPDPAADGGPTGEADPATVSTFLLDKYDVTVGRFRQFVAAWKGGWLPTAGAGKQAYLNGGQGLANSGPDGGFEQGWDALDWNSIKDFDPTDVNLTASCAPYNTWTPSVGGGERMPINCETWFEAYAFCVWDGGFLPSEAEWEYAAAGGNQQRLFPWGATAPGTDNEYAIYECDYPKGPPAHCIIGSPGSIAPVGTATRGAGRWGQLDLAGNVWQWTLDWYGPYVDPCVDCAYLSPIEERSIRGGNYSGSVLGLLAPSRFGVLPAGRAENIGLRCARSP